MAANQSPAANQNGRQSKWPPIKMAFTKQNRIKMDANQNGRPVAKWPPILACNLMATNFNGRQSKWSHFQKWPPIKMAANQTGRQSKYQQNDHETKWPRINYGRQVKMAVNQNEPSIKMACNQMASNAKWPDQNGRQSKWPPQNGRQSKCLTIKMAVKIKMAARSQNGRQGQNGHETKWPRLKWPPIKMAAQSKWPRFKMATSKWPPIKTGTLILQKATNQKLLIKMATNQNGHGIQNGHDIHLDMAAIVMARTNH